MVVWSKCEHDFCCLESRAPNRLQSFENGEFGVCGEFCDERRSLSAEWVIDDDDDGLNKRQTCLHYSFISNEQLFGEGHLSSKEFWCELSGRKLFKANLNSQYCEYISIDVALLTEARGNKEVLHAPLKEL